MDGAAEAELRESLLRNPTEDLELAEAWSPPQSVPSWHPKITLSRLIVISLTVGLGTAKAAASYRGEMFTAVTLEWIMTILLFQIFLVFSCAESKGCTRPEWLFRYDTLDLLWALVRKASISPPVYENEERRSDLQEKPRHAPLTLYRLLVSASVVTLGLSKATLSYLGRTTEPTTLEWVLGVFVTTGLYYLGLYEQSSTRVLGAIFEQDHTRKRCMASKADVVTSACDILYNRFGYSEGSGLIPGRKHCHNHHRVDYNDPDVLGVRISSVILDFYALTHQSLWDPPPSISAGDHWEPLGVTGCRRTIGGSHWEISGRLSGATGCYWALLGSPFRRSSLGITGISLGGRLPTAPG
ncbi:hypothetical protein BKA70DRAFT_1562988 [Coprinopsis sp. MPI-PUGE-AT-0042]|nr:hypothetical protein BKA70DRAFT_1562988 [Coprinopsis sp. MPI-PUGE-AT-0042]